MLRRRLRRARRYMSACLRYGARHDAQARRDTRCVYAAEARTCCLYVVYAMRDESFTMLLLYGDDCLLAAYARRGDTRYLCASAARYDATIRRCRRACFTIHQPLTGRIST